MASVVLLTALASCGGAYGAGAPSPTTSYPSLPMPSGTPAGEWPPPGQITVGNIPSDIVNASGFAFYPPPQNARTHVAQADAERDALANPAPYASSGQPVKVRHTYLVSVLARGDPVYHLSWVIDVSPDQPFRPPSGGGPKSGTQVADKWTWVIVSDDNGSVGTYWG